MTNPTQHRQVPDALRLAEEITNLECSSKAVAKTIAAAADELCRLHVENASLRASPTPPALSVALEAFLKSVIALCRHRGYSPANIEAWDKDDKWIADLWRQAESMLAASPTPPAEQPATKETSGGFHVWRDISTAPKDGSRFVATGHNYGLYSEVRHTCVAQWFRGCWMEASDWNETSELKYLTHWMPLPSPPDDVAAPAEQQAAPETALGVGNSGFDYQTAADFLSGKTVSDEAIRKFVQASRWAHDEKASLSAIQLAMHGVLTSREAEIALLKKALLEAEAAPQQEPVAWLNPWRADQVTTDYDAYGERGIPLYTAPQPAPAPLSEREAFERDWEKRHAPVPINGRTHDDGRYGDSSIQDAWESWQARAALAAQGGKDE